MVFGLKDSELDEWKSAINWLWKVFGNVQMIWCCFYFRIVWIGNKCE